MKFFNWYTYLTGSTKVINASRGPVPRSEPLSERSKPSSEIFLFNERILRTPGKTEESKLIRDISHFEGQDGRVNEHLNNRRSHYSDEEEGCPVGDSGNVELLEC